MFRRLALIFSVIAMGLALDGCTKCGPIWDDWVQSPKSCKSDRYVGPLLTPKGLARLASRLTR